MTWARTAPAIRLPVHSSAEHAYEGAYAIVIADGRYLHERHISIRRKDVAARLLAGLRDKLLAPERMETFVSEQRRGRILPCPDQPGIGYFF